LWNSKNVGAELDGCDCCCSLLRVSSLAIVVGILNDVLKLVDSTVPLELTLASCCFEDPLLPVRLSMRVDVGPGTGAKLVATALVEAGDETFKK
jgi:hypothetical protein